MPAREPQYRGRRLSEWIDLYSQAPSNSAANHEAANALRRIGTKGLPFYVEWLPRRGPVWPAGFQLLSQEVLGSVAEQPVVRHILTESSKSDARAALAGFRLLGPAASSAVPDLHRMLIQTNDEQLRVDAMIALAQIGENGLPPLLEVLKHCPHRGLRMTAAYQVGVVGPQAKTAIPTLICTLATDDKDVAATAAKSLGRIGADRPAVIPALMKALERQEIAAAAARALGEIGQAARPAIPALKRLLEDPDPYVRLQAADALRDIQGGT